MRKNVIHIFGAAGAGTSTLGRRISDTLGYTFMDTDDYFWLPINPPYSAKRDRRERLAMMKDDMMEAENAVVSGALADWGNELIPLFTLAVRLETDTAIRIERLQKREKEILGERIEPNGDMYQQHAAFLQWAKAYDTGGIDMRSKAEHDEWEKLLQCKQIKLNGADELEKNCKIIEEILINSSIS
ncbi:MAG: AAA family ATPase [Clostridiales bacterium]|nr:AAA family ATPase [Clostridiales bacterium]